MRDSCYYRSVGASEATMRRRQFIKGILGVAAAWPSKLHAQQAQLPVIGFVNSSSAQTQVLVAAAYRRGLEEVGFAEGRNVLIESRWADGNSERLPELISELLKTKVAIIMAGGLLLRTRQKRPLQRYPSSLRPAMIRSKQALLPASIAPVGI